MPSLAVDEGFRINGLLLSKTSCRHLIEGVPYTGILEVSTIEESREGEYVWGSRGDGTPLGVTSGLYQPGPFTFKTDIATAEQICEQLSVLSLTTGATIGSFGSFLFSYIVEIYENLLLPQMTISISNCKIEGRKFSVPADASSLQVEFTCKHQGITTSGSGLGLTGLPSVMWNSGI